MNTKNQRDRNLTQWQNMKTIPFLAAGLSTILAQTCKASKQGKSREYVYCDLLAPRSLSPNESKWIYISEGSSVVLPLCLYCSVGHTFSVLLLQFAAYYEHFIAHYFAMPFSSSSAPFNVFGSRLPNLLPWRSLLPGWHVPWSDLGCIVINEKYAFSSKLQADQFPQVLANCLHAATLSNFLPHFSQKSVKLYLCVSKNMSYIRALTLTRGIWNQGNTYTYTIHAYTLEISGNAMEMSLQ